MQAQGVRFAVLDPAFRLAPVQVFADAGIERPVRPVRRALRGGDFGLDILAGTEARI